MPGHELHDAPGAHAYAPVAQHAPYTPVSVSFPALLERPPDGIERPLVPLGPAQTLPVVVECAARQAAPSQQVAWLHGEPAGQMQYQTGPPGVGQVVGVCAPPFSQQLLRVADDLQLDLQLVALGAHPRQLRTYPVAFPPHAIKGSATVIAVPVLAGLRRSAPVRVVAHRTLLVAARKHLVLPVSHDIGTDPQLLADLPTRPGARGIFDHRLATRPRIHGSPTDPASARLQLVDPARQQRLARIAQRADRARRAPPVPQVMIDRRAFLPGRVAFPAPVAKRAAAVAAGLDPCPMPAHQHLPGRTPQLVDHRRRAAIVPLVQPHRTKPLLPRALHHQWTPFPPKSPKNRHHLRCGEKWDCFLVPDWSRDV